MPPKGWASFFIFLLSSQYMIAAASSHYRVKRQLSCQLKPEALPIFDNCFRNIRTTLPNSITVPDTTIGGMQMSKISVSNLKNFKLGSGLTCLCLPNRARVFFQLNFIDITVSFLLTVLESLLGGVLGGLGTAIVKLLGSIVNLLITILVPEIIVQISVDQPLVPGSNCQVSSFSVQSISAIRILNVDLTPVVVGLLGELLLPVLSTLITKLLVTQVKPIIALEIAKLSLLPFVVNCGGAPLSAAPLGGLPVAGSLVGNGALGSDPLINAPLGGAPLINAPLGGAPLINAPLGGAPLVNVPLGGAPLVNVPLGGAPLINAPLGGAPLINAPLGGAPLVNAPLGAPLVNAPLGGAPLGGVSGTVGVSGSFGTGYQYK